MNRKKTHHKCAVGVSRPFSGVGLLVSSFATTVLIALLAQSAHALPQNGQVTGGQAVITNPDGSSMRIDQSSQRAIINWQSYNIGANERVHYQQPNAQSVSLNRVNPQNGVSRIYGNLSSNGQVWLLNPAGIWFGPTARVDVAGILATTAGINDQDFMSGQYRFMQNGAWNGSVINEGVIVVHSAGLAAFVSPGVVNNGKITATLGTVVLASGTEFTIDFNGDQNIQFVVSGKVADFAVDENGNRLSSAVKNSGSISANGGKVIMTAQVAGKVLDNAINMSGYVEAKSVDLKNGEVVFGAGDGKVAVSGTVLASGKNAGEKGGKVKITGTHIVVLGAASIDVSGDIGGGEVLIGGDYLGKNAAVQNAKSTIVASGANIYADALAQGNAGKVIVWADDQTYFHGNIFARGGVNGGDGGFVETSGHHYLSVAGSFVDTRAPLGRTGTWLLDPTNIYIAANQGNATSAGMVGTDTTANTGVGTNPTTFQGSGVIQDSLLTTGNLATALASSNVIVTTTNTSGTGLGNITVVDAITWASANTLTLTAANNILINAVITTGSAASRLILNAAGTVTQTAIIAGSGGVTSQGAGAVNFTQANTYSGVTTVSNALTLSGAGTILNSAVTVAQGGVLTLDNSGTNNTNRISNSAAFTMTGGELVVIGNAGANTTETFGALTLPNAYSTITLTPNAARNTAITFASLSRSAGASILFRGTNLGANTVASVTANTSNIVFTAAPTLTGAGGNSGTTTVSIVAGAIGAGGAGGASSSGTDFVTYNPPTGSVNGLRPLLGTEYTATAATGVNLRLTANTTTNTAVSINSLLLSGGITYNYDSGGGATGMTLGGAGRSGNVLSINGANVIQTTVNPSGGLIFSTTQANIFAVSDLTLGSSSTMTGSGGLTKSGPGILLMNRSIALTGGVIVNAGTLRAGAANPFTTSQAMTVQAAGTLDLNGFAQTVSSLTMFSGTTSGAAVTTGAGTLSLGGNATLNVNGAGVTGATVAGTVAMTGNRTFTIADGFANNDLTMNAVISGAFNLIKAGVGTMAFNASNIYTGTTSVNAGKLTLLTTGSLGTTSSTTVASGATLDIGFTGTLGNTNAISLTGTGVGANGALIFTGGSATINNAITLTTTPLISGPATGTITFGGTISGATGVTFSLLNAGLSLSTVTLTGGGDVTMTTGGTISQTGVMTADVLTATTRNDSGSAITLTNASNNLATINLNARNSNDTANASGAISFTDANTFDVAQIRTTSTINLTAGTNITDSGAIAGSTLTTSSTTGTVLDFGHAISGFNATNTTSGVITLVNTASPLTITGISQSGTGNLSVTNTGSMDVTGGVTAGTGTILLSATGLLNVNQNISTTNNTISLTGVGITQAASRTVNSGSGAITYNAGTGTITTNTGSLVLSTGTITFIADDMALSTNVASQIGGTALGVGNAANTILTQSTNSTPIFVATTGAGLQLSAAELDTIRSTNLRLGNSNSGAITLAAWSPTQAYSSATGMLTFQSGAGLTQSGALTLGANGRLILRGAGNFVLNSNNVITNIAATLTSGSVSITNASAAPLTVASLTDDLGTVNGMSAASGVTLIAPGAAITLNQAVTANIAGDAIVLSGNQFINNVGAAALVPGVGRFLVWTVNPASDTRNSLAYDFKQYNATFGVTTVLGSGDGYLYTVAPIVYPVLTGTVSKVFNGTNVATIAGGNYSGNTGAIDGDTVVLNNPSTGTYDNKNVGTSKAITITGLSITSATNGAATVYGYQTATPISGNDIGTITAAPITVSSDAGQTKVYGTNDSAGAATAYTVSGTLYGSDTVTGSMGRVAGETVAQYNFTQNTVAVSDGNGGNNYAITFNGTTNKFAITARSTTGSIANQTKVYGANDPTLSGIAVTLGNIVNTSVTDINGTVTVINDTGNVAVTLATLTRAAGELVSGSPYSISAATFNALTGSASSNYSAPTFTGTPTLTVTPASLTGSIANQTKVYGANDPMLSGIGVTLTGIINNPAIVTWNGNVAINDTANVSVTLATLTRAVGELVSGSPYNITSGTFNALTGSAASNYSAPSYTGTPTLTITPKSLTGSIANQTKVYGANDPTLSGIGVTLTGVINNPAIVTWNGNVAINDTANVGVTLATLTRAAGELVSGSPYNITSGTFNALTGSAAGNYSAPSFTGTPTLTITPASLTGSIANQTKVYGANDPTLSGIGVTLTGIINNPAIVTWNGNVAINDSGNVATTLASLTRTAGELVSGSPYNITSGTFNALTGSAAGNYSAPSFTGTPTLTITPASLTGSIANQTKVYGANDPTLSGIGVTLTGIINNPAIVTWNGNVAINDSGNVATTLASLTRTAGELVSGSPYSITAATFNTLTGTAAGNYSAPSFTGTPTLTITPASLTGSIANQTKVYGANDPTLSGIGVTLTGIINNPAIVTWNGNVAINDSGNVATTLASLTRTAGELVSGSPYSITAGTFNALTGSASSNYSAPSFTGAPTLTITPASLTGSIANQTKVYGANDPTLSGIGVTLTGIINNPAIVTWNGNVAINDSGNVATTLASLTRTAGELVSGSPYSITAATFNALTGSASSNYSAPSFTGTPTLTITPASLTGSIANQTKVYGANDPTLSGIGVTLTGIINNPAIVTWNGNVAINDSGNVVATLASLTRAVGELVSGSPYNITAGTFNALTGSAAGNYSAPSFTGTPTLTITPASLTGSIANQTKVYGANDPTISGIGVTLTGVVNNPAIVTWNGNVAINDSGNVATTLASLVRTAGELVSGSPYSITSATFNALTGSAAGNYSAPSFTGTPTLTITPASLTGSIANQTKVYGANDPTLSGIGVTLTGIINNPAIVTWNGNVAINDSGNVATTLASLVRTAGELVSGSPYSITSATFNALTGTASGNYSAPSFTGTPTLTVTPASLTGSIANQTKVYGANDPTLSGIGVTLTGIINNPAIVTWNGNVAINDSGNVATTLASLTRAAGESVSGSPYNITSGTFNALTGSAAGNYSAPSFTGTPTLTITPASLTGSIANQTKIYGANDPTLSGIGVTLTGIINNPAIVTWNGNVAINDSGNVATTLASLTRAAGELVSGSPYNITSGTFNALTGSAAGNYSAPSFTGTPTLTITPASLTGSIANQTKIYGANDPTLSGIGVTLTGIINNPAIVTWNGNVAINDSGNVATTLASLTRAAGESVSGSPYNITSGTFNALTGSAAGNYSAPSFTGTPTLTITPASLTGSIANQTKIYGANDPTLSGIGVTLTGIINNPAIVTWNGNVAINDSGNVATTLASLTRAAGELVSGSPYNITSGTFNALTGSAAGNYSAPSFTGTPTLTITPASLTGSIANQTKIYGANDPTLSGIGVTLTGIINNPAIVTWNGNVAINDSGNVATTLASLTRAAGESVSGSPYNITSGTFNALTGSAAGNYSAPSFTGAPTLTITPASLTGSIANQTKVYGANDPTLSGIGVTLTGIINNPAIVTWNGNVAINDSGNVATTLASLTRAAGELVSGSPYNITSGTFNALTGSAAGNYSAPSFTGTPTLTVTPASLTGSIANQTKVYGANDPTLSGIGVTLTGIINNPSITTWNGTVSINDSGNVVTTLASLTRTAGELVSGSPYSITAATFNALTGSASSNYSAPSFTGAPTLTITPASLTGSIANQAKVYGANDPTLSGIGVTLTGIINNPAIVTWNGNVAINDSGNVVATLASLTRTVGELVSGSPYNITAGTFNALTGSAAGNYSAPSFTGTPTLTITPASLTGSIANQTKVYGANDPTLSGIGVTLTGIINNPAIVTWNGNVAINDSGNVATTLASLTRAAGELVSGSPYNITSGTFNALTGSAAGNYSAPSFTGAPTLTITPASLTGSIANQTKVYGANDPTLSGIGVTLTGIINNPAIVTWNGNVAINDSGNVATTLASLTRTVGELVSGSPYSITAATFNTLTGTAAGNYSAPSFTGTPTLTITPASLTGSIANQTKVYGANDPTVSGIGVTLTGIINNPAIVTWNGNVAINDSGNVVATLASLTRAVGELVSGSPYNITAGTFNALTGSAAGNYSAPSFTGTPTLTVTPASLTGSIANQTKVYGENDPTLSGIGVTLTGVINNLAIVTWNGNVAINDSGNVATTLASLVRTAGELVSGSPYSITAATFNTLTGTAAGNYSAPSFTGTPTLTVTPASLTGSIANQTKVYGANDPTLSGIGVTLTGIINNPAIVTWNGNVAINDSGNVATTLASLVRTAGELVSGSPYSITSATFNALTGTASGNYSAPSFTGTPTLTITSASLTGSIANQTKVYGANDPTLSGIGVTLTGIINNPAIVTWNGNVAINDSGNVVATLASLTRAVGELVSGSPYNITAGTFNALTGSAAGNYSAPSFTGTPTLTITPASLTGSIANQTKVYGANDPTISEIGVTLTGVVNNPAIVTWNGNVAINDSGNVATTLASLVRTAGELVSGSPYSITSATFNALTGSAAGNYSAPSFTGTPTLTVTPASLTGSIANQTKVYGANDPTLSGIGVTLTGIINNPAIVTWNGNVAINDSGNVATTLASLTRIAGELVSGSPYNITSGTFNALTGSAAGNYSAPSFTGTPTLTVTPASLTGSIANQTKVYGANDPTLSGIGVTLTGVINNPAIVTWNGNVAINDSGNVATTLASLTRTAGELVSGSPYNITSGTFNALTGSAAGNYSAPSFTGTPTLTITPASLTGSIANQTKVYGANDPTLSGIGVTLTGIINNPAIVTWNGNVAINDSGNVATTLASLTRTAGELVSGSPYSITAATFNALTGSASSNYSAPSFTGTPTLTITPASLTGSIANQTKVYGANDPTLSGIGVTLTGIINNPAIVTWNGNVAINDSGNVVATLASLTRAVGELVSGSPYNITAGTFNALTGSAAGNYSAPSFTGTPTLTITPASLTGSIANQTKVYGANDPTLSGIGVTLTGIINNPSITTWNGTVSINDSGNVVTTLASLTRTAGELVSGSPYSITAATFNALTGSASSNYSAPSFTGAPTLTITPASLTGSIANQTKVYGANDPTLSGIGVTLTGIINNPAIVTWNGNVAINDSGNVVATLASLTRTAGELVSGSPYNITAGTFNALTGSAAGNYSAPSFTGTPTLTITPASLTGSIANQTKVYGANDPTLSGIGVTLTGIINNPAIVTWNGNVAINDSGNVATTLASLTRAAGESVSGSPYNITSGTFNALTGSAAGNYSAPSFTGAPTLTITPASLTGSIANQTKVYGANDPTLSGIGVTLTGIINNPAIVTWNGNVAINDSGNVATTLASLTRAAGESVSGSPYNITSGTFNALTGSAAGNYSAPSFTGAPTLTITPASLTGSIANQTKVYGANDPTLSGIGVTLTGIINNPAIVTWNGNVAINDSGNVATTLASLTRAAGESVSGSPYNITSGTFNALTGSAAGNYSAPSFTGTPTLTVTPASLTGSIANQTKVYGANDPTLSGIGVTLTGVINNPAIVTWNGNVAINDSGNVATTLASLTRTAGELVSGSPYNITSGTFNALTGSAAGNYSAPSFTGAPTLTITPASLTGSIANQTKVYGANDPTLSGIGVTLTGIINNPAIVTWNGNVAINDSGNVATTLASLTRTVGELVSGSPYSITAATFNTLTGTAAGNYSAPSFTGTPTLTITPASLTGSIANQTKVYGANDPTVSGIGVTLTGIINNPAIVTWNGNVAINDSGNVATTLASLTRTVGELVSGSPYSITAATFNTLTGTAAGNYSAPSFTGTPTLTITPASLTGSIANQTKVYGANDPTVSGIGVTLTGIINNPAIVTWNGNVAINDSGNVVATLASLTRAVGELVSGSPYNITAGTFNALTGSAAGNYSAPSFTGTPTLTVTPASLTGSIANQTKVYGENDPTLSGIGVTLTGVINNPAIVTWNGNVAINDSGNVATTLASLVRTAGELVSGSPYSITSATFNALTGTASGNYSAPSFTGTPTLTVTPASLTGSIANQTKVYGANDPTLSGIGVTLTGIINNPAIVTWNGNVAINDSGNVATTLASLTRIAGELVSGSPYNITSGTFNALTGSAAGNYSAPSFTGTPTLTVTPASLTGSIANQTKVYGANDPTLSGIGVTLTGVINNPAIVTWNGNVAINDTANVGVTLATLTRAAGELVSGSPYNITSGTFNALTGSASSNYSAPTFTGTPTLTITPASLTGSIANQTKVYGANDPTLSGIGVTLTGIINNPAIVTWNGNVAINDSGNVATTLASLVRAAGELVSGSPYNITSGTFNALTGTAASNYSAPTFTGTPTLTITPASLTGSIANQTKIYGANDPTLSGIGVTLTGVVNNPAIVTWNGNVAINDSGNVAATLASLVRTTGELVSGSPYSITSGTFNALTGSAASNYSAPTFTGTPTLTITPASLTGSIANQTKVYGANDPTLSGIGVTLTGVINNPSISTWNGTVSINDSGNVATTLASLVRAAGELVSGSPYNITSGTFNALTGTAASNYSAPTFTGTPTLTITPASLTGSIANQTKVYGANDPTLSGIGVTLTGVVNNPAIVTWNGNVAINDSGNVAATLASLVRTTGELVSGSPYSITSGTFNALTGSAASNYSAPTFTGTPTLTITPASLTGSIANQTKVYGANDPTLSGIGVTLTGVINNPSISTWNGTVSINDSGNVATTLASLVRAAGELVSGSPYNITSGTFNALTGTAASNYSAPTFTGTSTLTITPASLTGSIANQTKIYGANDPTLSGIGVTLTGVVNNPAIVTWNGNVAINDSGNVAATLASLTRAVGELVSGSPYNITSGTFNALTGTAASNYSAPTFTGTPTLTITPASLTGSIANQTKVYGANDPTLSGIGVTLTGVINNPAVVTWNGNVAINDSGNVATTLLSLTRTAGELVSGSPYSISSGTFDALTGTASSNYSAPTFTGTPTLTITQASLTGSIANQTKVYGANDPALSGIGVTLTGVINNPSISTWNGNVAINDSGNVATTLASLTRTAGELVSGSPYNITSGTFNALTGSASGNYSAPTFTGTPTLTITPASLTGSIANQTKVYGANDPTLSGIGVTLAGVINNPLVSTWNGNVAINDSGNVTTTLASLTRTAGELVSGSPYNITSGTFNALTGSASGNYSAPTFTGTPTLTITPASLTGSIANQTKVYGANDPTLSGIGVTLAGVINNPLVSTWNGTVAINDTGNVATTLAGLSRVVGESVATYAINSANFNPLTGSASSNYASPILTGAPTLTITKTTLTATIPNQSKVYGTADPTPDSINATLGGIINNPAVVTWNGNVSINDTGLVTSSLASYSRAPGETVLGGPYAITTATFNPLTGSASGNYDAPVSFSNSPTLTITPATLTASLINGITKVYDQSANATLSSGNYLLTGVVGLDDVVLNDPVNGSYDNANAGTNKLVAVTGLAISGLSASNYQLAATTIAANIGNISQAALTISNVVANNKVFDNSTNAVLNLSGATLSGVLLGDDVTVAQQNYTANFVSSNVGNNIPVIVSSISLSGSASGNYALTMPTGLTANITAAQNNNTFNEAPFQIVFPTQFSSPEQQITASRELAFSAYSEFADDGSVNMQRLDVAGGCVKHGPLIEICSLP